MKRVLFVIICLSVVSITQAAIVAFEAEDDSVYYQAGDKWLTIEDETALNGLYITGSENLPPVTETSFRGFQFPVIAGTYHLFIRLELEEAGGWANNDSFYRSNSFDQADAVSTVVNQIDTWFDVEGNGMASVGFKWTRIQTGTGQGTPVVFTMAADGTGYFKISPREDGLRFDAFAFVPAADSDTVTSAELDEAVISSGVILGAATDPVPSDKNAAVDSQTTTAVSWTAPADPNLASISGYDVVFGTEPNMLLNPVYQVSTESLPVTLDYETSYYWRVDTHVVWDSNEITGVFNETVTGKEWMFTTLPFDLVPLVTANNVLTSMPYLPAGLTGTIDDRGQDDIVSVAWEVLGTTAVPAAMQMITRTQSLSEVTANPNLLMDWIGTDTREVGEPMYLSLKGLPAGTYNWLSYHHDAENQNGVFDVTVYDASGTAETTGIAYRNGNSLPVITVPLTITSNGTDDVVLAFDLQSGTFFVMNGFELTDGVSGDPLFIDFGTVVSAADPNAVNVMDGYQAYTARHEVAATFTEQSFSAFGTTVSILPTWGGMEATVTDTTNDPSSASQSATLNTNWPGAYRVQLSAADRIQTGSGILIVTVAADPCAAAQRSAFWTGFSAVDFNQDCVVNLDDFALMASAWLDDRNMTAQE